MRASRMRRGRLAGAEAGEADLAGDLAERDVDVPVELGLVHLDRQLDLVPLEGLDRALHRAASVPADAGVGAATWPRPAWPVRA